MDRGLRDPQAIRDLRHAEPRRAHPAPSGCAPRGRRTGSSRGDPQPRRASSRRTTDGSLERAEDERGRRRSGILMPDAPRPEVGRSTLPGLHRERRLDARRSPPRWRRAPLRPWSRRPATSARTRRRPVPTRRPSSCRPAWPRPAPGSPSRPARRRGQEHLAVRPSPSRRASRRSGGSPSRRAGPQPRRPGRRASCPPPSRSAPGDPSGDDCKRGDGGREPALHVHPVVGIADRRVELGEEVTLLLDPRGRLDDPAAHELGVEDECPQRTWSRHRPGESSDRSLGGTIRRPGRTCQTDLHRPVRFPRSRMFDDAEHNTAMSGHDCGQISL